VAGLTTEKIDWVIEGVSFGGDFVDSQLKNKLKMTKLLGPLFKYHRTIDVFCRTADSDIQSFPSNVR
jgi:hypothetical protein